jgi:hypothetical protein
MITFFTTAKPFRGHAGTIQRNALKSWTLLHPDVEVILFGDEEGAAEAARELGIRHEPHVERSEYGTKRLDYLFTTARALARHEVLCYVNCDIILMDDFCRALEQVRAAHARFLMVGRRWDAEIWEPYYFTRANWQARLKAIIRQRGRQRTPEWIDYFAFSRDLYGSTIPPLVVGRVHWDHWLVWRALACKEPVVDVSPCVMAVHQNHDYSYHPQGKHGVWHDEESRRNLQLAGGYRHLRTIDCAQLRLTANGLARNRLHWLSFARRRAMQLAEKSATTSVTFLQNCFWHPLLNLTRPIRHRAGLRQETMRPAFARDRSRHYRLDE